MDVPPANELEPSAGGLSAQVVVAGACVGALLALANLYLGLTAGLWDSGSITASVLGFSVAGLVGKRARFGPVQNALTQSLASAAGAMPAAAGLLGAIPAAVLLGQAPASLALLAWGLGLGVLGVVLAALLRQRLLVEENLSYPTGVATAEVIRALHQGPQEAGKRARALLLAGLVAIALTWFRDGKPALIPQALFVPGTILGCSLATLGIGLSFSPLMSGVGLVAGLSTGGSVALGSLLGWLALAPWAISRGTIAIDSPLLARFVAWPGVALMVGAAAVSLLQQARTFAQAGRDLLSARGRVSPGDGLSGRVTLALVAGACVAVVLSGRALFSMSPGLALLCLVLSIVFGSVCARAAGQTDIAPLGQVGELTQALSGPMTRGLPLANAGAGGVVSGQAAQVGVSLWSLRAGAIVGAPVRAQVWSMLVGAGVGMVVIVPAWALLVKAYGVAQGRLPAPAALQFKALAELVSGGANALPPGAVHVTLVAAALGIALALMPARLTWLPNPVAMGIGFLIPAHLAIALLVGAAGGALWQRSRPGSSDRLGPVIGAGAIAGESIAGLVVALCLALGWLSP
ncbi:MAG: OPT/YSL family transporter [Deltaproteobacteria bacterium]|nr:OPT/YSL family transporter [Deltaproteobacteria bacterium]